MKKRYLLLLIPVFLLLIWIGSIGWCSLLTNMFGQEFSNFEAIGFDYMHPWDGEPEYRVLSYSPKKATVYYFANTGGEKAVFVKNNGNWTYQITKASWSALGGTADDYLIWPYFKDLVP